MSETPLLRSGLYCLLLYLIIISVSCIKNENPTFPETEIVEISNITDTSITAEGIISFAEIIPIDEYGFCWDTFRFKDRPLMFIKPVSDSSRAYKFKSVISKNLFKYKDHRISTYYILDNDTIVSPSKHFVLFLAKRPAIWSIDPDSATWGDTISIRGINLGNNKDSISICFNGIQSELVVSGDASLKVIVPDSLSDEHPLIELIVSDKNCSEENMFRLLKSSFYDYSPKSFIGGTVITLFGNNIPINEKSVSVHSNNIVSKIISYSDTSLKFIYPVIPDNSNPEIKIRTGISWHTIAPPPNIIKPKYTLFYPFTGSWSDTIFIKGSGFGTDTYLHSVYFGDLKTSPFFSCDTLLKVLFRKNLLEWELLLGLHLGVYFLVWILHIWL